jgi:hypothetical protein
VGAQVGVQRALHTDLEVPEPAWSWITRQTGLRANRIDCSVSRTMIGSWLVPAPWLVGIAVETTVRIGHPLQLG